MWKISKTSIQRTPTLRPRSIWTDCSTAAEPDSECARELMELLLWELQIRVLRQIRPPDQPTRGPARFSRASLAIFHFAVANTLMVTVVLTGRTPSSTVNVTK
jgi:uncharacterized protein YcbX